MKQKITRTLVMIGLGVASGVTYAVPGYVDDSQAGIVRTGQGECLRTGRWSVPNAVAQCDPEIVAARDAVDIAAVEVMARTERRPVHLRAHTLFAFDSDRLSEDGAARLDAMLGDLTADMLQEQKIQIVGYSDRLGSDAYNLELSRRRAAAVHEYLVAQGVVPGFIETRGLGAADPVVDCTGKRGPVLVDCLAPNRRAEIEFSAVEVTEVQDTPADP